MWTIFLSTFGLSLIAAEQPPLNLLYILVDDLRPELGAYGITTPMTAGTPNMDRLAGDSLLFERAYAQQAVCGPSRNSFLSGRRPDTTKTYTFRNSFRDVGQNWTSMLGFLKSKGYTVAGTGKVYHPRSPPMDDGNSSWSNAFLPYPEWSQGQDPCPGSQGYDPFLEMPVLLEGRASDRLTSSPTPSPGPLPPANAINGPACPLPNSGRPLVDELIADLAVGNIVQLVANSSSPFVVAAGFHKPHLPWAVPEKYYHMAPPVSSISLAAHPQPPEGMPDIAFWSCSQSELSGYANVNITPATPLDDTLARHWRQGYYASVRYVDDQVGKLLAALEATGQLNNTVVVLHSDHGWQLGEHGEWCKQTNFELATRVPLMIRVPPQHRGAYSRGQRTRALVELVDIYRTVAELLGLGEVEAGVEGTSFAHLLEDPNANHSEFAFSQYPRCAKGADCMMFDRDQILDMGFTLRSESARYTEWRTWNGTALCADWSENGLVATELYLHRSDPVLNASDFDSSENKNIAGMKQYNTLQAKLAGALSAQFGHTTEHVSGFY